MIFLYSRSNIWKKEFEGDQAACPVNAKLVGIRVRKDQDGVRLFRPGDFASQRQVNEDADYLWTSGFKDRLATYNGWENPAPLRIDIQYGNADFTQAAQDIFGLTKLLYNTCRPSESQPVTVVSGRFNGGHS